MIEGLYEGLGGATFVRGYKLKSTRSREGHTTVRDVLRRDNEGLRQSCD